MKKQSFILKDHILVNYVADSLNSFVAYSHLVRQEMTKRGYRTMENVWIKIKSVVDTNIWMDLEAEDIFEKEHNDRYFLQCYYNLQEKYDRGGISQEDWDKIDFVRRWRKLSEIIPEVKA